MKPVRARREPGPKTIATRYVSAPACEDSAEAAMTGSPEVSAAKSKSLSALAHGSLQIGVGRGGGAG
jgi:hypothetical protein